MKGCRAKSPSRGRITKGLMKILTVLAAALAAGLTTFAANAAEENPPQATNISLNPEREIAALPDNQEKADDLEKTEKVRKDDASSQKGLTAEEVLDAAKTAKPEQPYKNIIERYASENGVPLVLAHAVITVESNGRADVRGKAGEIGLMQIKPATARGMGYKGSADGLFDPETNIRYGMLYLAKAHELAGGNTCGTILRYNAGHAAKRMNKRSAAYCSKVKLLVGS